MTEYVPVSWSREPITTEKLQQMATNDQALFEMKPTTVIKHNGVTRSKGMKILAGSQLFQPSNTYGTTNTIYFGNFFSAGCNPIVIPTVLGHPQMGMSLTPHGIGGQKLIDHRGFNVYIWADDRNGNNARLSNPYYITYIAIGF